MDLKEKLISSYFAFEEQVDTDSEIHDIRSEAIKNFETVGFPSRKDEEWKYTSLKSLLKEDYSLFPKKEDTLDYKDVKQYLANDIDSYNIVFIDGIYSSYLSQTTHDKFDACLMSSALSKPKYKAIIDNYFNKIAPKGSGLNNLNTAFSKEGAFINIPKNIAADKPIQIINLSTGNESALMLQPRNLVIVGENSQVQIIERHQSLNDNPVFTNSVTEIFAEKRAIVDYYKIQNDRKTASLIDNTFVEQHQESLCSVHTFSFGGKLVRNNLEFYQKGERIDSTMKGVTIIEGKQHVDHNTLVHHIEPNCEKEPDGEALYTIVDDFANYPQQCINEFIKCWLMNTCMQI